MAIWRVWSGASGADDGTSWADAYVTLDRAADSAINTGLAAGDFIYIHVGSTLPHNETGTGTVGTDGPSTERNPIKILGVDKDNSDALTVSTTNNISGTTNIALNGIGIYQYGIRWSTTGGDISLENGNIDTWHRHERCRFTLDSSATSRTINLGGGGSSVMRVRYEFIDTDFAIGTGASATGFNMQHGTMTWRGGTLLGRPGGGDPRHVITAMRGSRIEIDGVDLSTLSATGHILESLAEQSDVLRIMNCKMPTGWETKLAELEDGEYYGTTISVEHSDDGTDADPAFQYHMLSDFGEVSTETGIYRTGGASDGERTNPVSWKAIANANATLEIYSPMEVNRFMPLAVWIDGDGATAKTLTVHVASGTTWQDDELWAKFEYPSEADTSALKEIQTTRADPLGTPANVSTDGSTWTGAGVGTKQKLEITITPDKPGWVFCWLHFAPGSVSDETVFFDPQIVVS